MEYFIITLFTKDISQVDLIGLILGHLVFAIAMTKLLDWKWLANLMSKEDKIKMQLYMERLISGWSHCCSINGSYIYSNKYYPINEHNLHPFIFF